MQACDSQEGYVETPESARRSSEPGPQRVPSPESYVYFVQSELDGLDGFDVSQPQ